MTLRALLREVEPGWYAGAADLDGAGIAPEVLARAQDSALGRRMLARWLLGDGATHLLAPSADGALAAVAQRWPRTRLAGLLRDLGTLAHAPVIRAEVRREPVRRLKQALGKNYLLPLDAGIWDGRVDKPVFAQLARALEQVLATQDDDAVALFAVLDAQGLVELVAWGQQRDPALAEWAALLHPRVATGHAHLPEKPVWKLLDHHQTRTRAA